MRLTGRFTERRALAFTLCWVLALAVTGSTDVLLFLAPALLIAVPLFCGRYFGEELIAKLAARRNRKPRRARLAPALTPGAPRTWRPRGRRLIAFSLAERPPPLRLLTEF
jgi:hypothetical protein